VTACIARDRELRGEGRLRPAQQRGQHLARRVHVVVDGLLAARTSPGASSRTTGGQQLRHGQRLDVLVHVRRRLDQDRAVRAHGQRGAQRLLRLVTPIDTAMISLATPLFLQPDRLLDGDLVEGVHRHLDVGEIDTRAVRLHADLHVVVDHALHRHENLHACISCCVIEGLLSVPRARETGEKRRRGAGRRGTC
jgi:hypothetical protein